MVANFIDARSTYTLGHSPAVAALSEAAAGSLGLSQADATTVKRAALLHDLGRTGVPVTIWEKQSALSAMERERIEQHPSLTEVILARSQSFGHLGTMAGLHHERLDGSGYRRVTASFISLPAQILAVADAYQTKVEARPYRRGLSGEAAAASLRALAAQGKLDYEVVGAVVSAAGQSSTLHRPQNPAGLSDREIEVLCLVARGMSTRQIADVLVLSPKTVGNHIERIYDKIDVSSRVGATLFALRHHLILDSPQTPD
jgi:putative nucleotidyltransferase with HDIG domain